MEATGRPTIAQDHTKRYLYHKPRDSNLVSWIVSPSGFLKWIRLDPSLLQDGMSGGKDPNLAPIQGWLSTALTTNTAYWQ